MLTRSCWSSSATIPELASTIAQVAPQRMEYDSMMHLSSSDDESLQKHFEIKITTSLTDRGCPNDRTATYEDGRFKPMTAW
jgi:hypothetical protein